MGDVTRILAGIEKGDPTAAEQLLPLVYEELRSLAAQRLAREKPGQTLQPTALVHDAYLRLVDTLLLDYEQRQRPEGSHTALRGTRIEMALAQPVRLQTDDRLILDDDTLIEIVARPEPLYEVRAASSSDLARIAWMLGDRHLPVDISERRLRLRRDPAISALLSDAEWEQAFAESIIGQGDERSLAMQPSRLSEFITLVRQRFEDAAREGEAPVLVTSAGIRPFVRSIVERFRAQTSVLSQAEIHPRARLKTVGSI